MHPTFALEIRSCDAWHWRIGDGLYMFFLHPYYTVSFVSGCRLSFDWVGVWSICDLGLSLFPYSSLFPFSFFSCPYFLLQGCLIGTSPQKQRLKVGPVWLVKDGGSAGFNAFELSPVGMYIHYFYVVSWIPMGWIVARSIVFLFNSLLCLFLPHSLISSFPSTIFLTSHDVLSFHLFSPFFVRCRGRLGDILERLYSS